jgi:hypothetical protein
MSQFYQMAGCESGAQLVIENDGIDVFKARLAIEIDQGNGLLEKDSQQIEIGSGRTMDDAGNLAFDFPTGRGEPRVPPEVYKTISDSIQSCQLSGADPKQTAEEGGQQIDSFLAG